MKRTPLILLLMLHLGALSNTFAQDIPLEVVPHDSALPTLLLATSSLPRGQGTIEFRVMLDGAHAIPPNSSMMVEQVEFELRPGNNLLGGSIIEDFFDVTEMAIFRATPSDVGIRLFQFTPEGIIPPFDGTGGGMYYSFEKQLTSSELVELQSGMWWVSVITQQFPDGKIRGQIAVVPESSAVVLLAFGAFTLGVFRFSQARARSVARRGAARSADQTGVWLGRVKLPGAKGA